MSRPVFVLLRGAWPAHDAGVASPPSSTEPGTAPSRPRCPRRAQHPPKPDWPGDVEAIRKAVSDLMQEDDVVVVMRSFNLPGGAGQAELSIEGEDVKGVSYQDVDEETVAELAMHLRPQSLAPFWNTKTHAAWRDIPTTYVLCLKDKSTTVVAAQYLVGMARASGRHKIDNVIEVDAGHSPVHQQSRVDC